MLSVPFVTWLEQPADSAEIDLINAMAFGPGRYAKTAYRLREGVPHDPALSFVATDGTTLLGSVRLTPIRIGAGTALLLGPLAVRPDLQKKGAGKALMAADLDAARLQGHDLVVLVGDPAYYVPFGFRPIPPGHIRLPGPVDPARFLALPLTAAGAALGGDARRIC